MLNSIFAPLRSEVHGSFGSSAIILLVALVPLLYAFRIKVPIAITITWAVCVLLFLCALGQETPVHYYFWKYFPLAQSFRIPGRITMIFPFLFLLILAWLLKPLKRAPLFPILSMMALFVLYPLVLVKHLPGVKYYSPANISSYPGWADTMISWTGLASLALIALYLFYLKRYREKIPWHGVVVGMLLAAAAVAQVTVEFRYGTWVKDKSPRATLAEMDRQKTKTLDFQRDPGFGMESIDIFNQKKFSIVEPVLAKFYRNIHWAADQKNAYRFLRRENASVTAAVEASGEEGAFKLAKDLKNAAQVDWVRLQESSFNRLVFSVEAGAPGFLTVHYPYTGHWRARVNGIDKEIYRANGHMLAVYAPVGRHEIEIRYWSKAAFAGMLISGLTFLFAGIYFAFFVFREKKRIIVIAASILIPAVLITAWYASLYSGDNLNARYIWSSRDFPSKENMAYAKRTWMNSGRPLFYAGLGVDGSIGKPFKTFRRQKGWWRVDLGSAQPIGEIVIYDARSSRERKIPLNIRGSMDGKTFEAIKTVTNEGKTKPWRIPMNGEKTRFIKIAATSKGSLSFKEVEIYPPQAMGKK
jgi:hypothetical protein